MKDKLDKTLDLWRNELMKPTPIEILHAAVTTHMDFESWYAMADNIFASNTIPAQVGSSDLQRTTWLEFWNEKGTFEVRLEETLDQWENLRVSSNTVLNDGDYGCYLMVMEENAPAILAQPNVIKTRKALEEVKLYTDKEKYCE